MKRRLCLAAATATTLALVGCATPTPLDWRYTLALPARGRVWHVQFDDWMHLVDERVLLNRAVMSLLGIRLGEVTLAFTRL